MHTEDIIDIGLLFVLPAVGAGLVAWLAHNKLKRSGNKYPMLIGAGIFLACYVLIFSVAFYIILSQIRLVR